MTKDRDLERFPLGKAWVVAQWVLLVAALLFVALTLRGQAPPQGASLGVPTLELSLRRALDLALAPDGNARVAIAKEMVAEAKARSGQARADLLPNIDGTVSQSSQTRNLQAFGIQLNLPLPGFEQPRFVGPFDVFDARLSATQTIFSMSAIRRYQASREGISIARAEEELARQSVSASVAKAYYNAQRAEAQQEAAEANLALARELEDLTANQKSAGTGLAVEVTRASVQRSQAEQVLIVRQNELRAAKLQLLRLIGLSLSGEVELSDAMQAPLDEAPTLTGAMERATNERPDWQSQQSRLKNAGLLASASKWERAPSIAAFGDYGASGSTPGISLPTRAVGVQMRVPIFDGGRRESRRAEALARQREEELRARDLKQQIELELRLALDALQSTKDQVRVARQSLSQAELELEQAQRRYRAGVANSLEITRAQTSVEQARGNNIDSLYRYNAARVDYALALGDVENAIP